MTFGSLFAGIGGFDLGFERAGLKCLWQCEIDEYCTQVLKKHWPNVRRWDDVRTFPPKHGDWDVDVICGGDPCQENSNARKHGYATQPSLGGEFIRVVASLRPKIVVRENPSAVRRDAPWPWWRFRSKLESLGYAVLPFRLRACCFGFEHRRDRLFLLSTLADFDTIGPKGDELEKMEDATPRADGFCSANRCNRRCATSRICRGNDGIFNRLDRVGSLGNAVVPQIAEWIGRRIMETVK